MPPKVAPAKDEKPANNGEANKKMMARKVVIVQYDLSAPKAAPAGKAPTGKKKGK